MPCVIGVDEVGRGPLAGPVLAVAVLSKRPLDIPGLRDSKKLSAKQRQKLYDCICQQVASWAWAVASVKEIDTLNILSASLLAMQRATMQLKVKGACRVFVDGQHCPDLALPTQAIIGGDNLVAEISAASILAKVIRDKFMCLFDKRYPAYGFAQHKGYPTKAHLLAIKTHGVTPLHRRSFAPVKAVIGG